VRRKPKAPKYRNLYARGGAIYYERVVGERRVRFSTKTDDWELAASVRDHYEEVKRIGKVPFLPAAMPRFDEFARRYLEEDTAHLAPTTRRDRPGYLRQEGPLSHFFASRRLDEIDPRLIFQWWATELQGRGLSPKTCRSYLDVLSAILGYAVDLEILDVNPVTAFREALRRRSRTQRSRADADPGRHVRPIEEPDELERLLASAALEGPPP